MQRCGDVCVYGCYGTWRGREWPDNLSEGSRALNTWCVKARIWGYVTPLRWKGTPVSQAGYEPGVLLLHTGFISAYGLQVTHFLLKYVCIEGSQLCIGLFGDHVTFCQVAFSWRAVWCFQFTQRWCVCQQTGYTQLCPQNALSACQVLASTSKKIQMLWQNPRNPVLIRVDA